MSNANELLIIDSKLRNIIELMKQEFERATDKFGEFNSAHEGYAVLLEEVDELWEAVKLNQKKPERNQNIFKEAIQVGAMAMRLIYDCISFEITNKAMRENKELNGK